MRWLIPALVLAALLAGCVSQPELAGPGTVGDAPPLEIPKDIAATPLSSENTLVVNGLGFAPPPELRFAPSGNPVADVFVTFADTEATTHGGIALIPGRSFSSSKRRVSPTAIFRDWVSRDGASRSTEVTTDALGTWTVTALWADDGVAGYPGSEDDAFIHAIVEAPTGDAIVVWAAGPQERARLSVESLIGSINLYSPNSHARVRGNIAFVGSDAALMWISDSDDEIGAGFAVVATPPASAEIASEHSVVLWVWEGERASPEELARATGRSIDSVADTAVPFSLGAPFDSRPGSTWSVTGPGTTGFVTEWRTPDGTPYTAALLSEGQIGERFRQWFDTTVQSRIVIGGGGR